MANDPHVTISNVGSSSNITLSGNHAPIERALTPQMYADTEFAVNVRQKIIVVTEDKAYLCLQRHVERMGRKQEWIAPAGLALSLLATLVAATFQNFFLPAATWQALFILAFFGSLVWLARAAWAAFQCPSMRDVISELKEESRKTTQTP